MTDIPSDFDWVSARKQCSAVAVFEQIRQEARRNVETFHAGLERVRGNYVPSQDGTTFSVVRQEFRGLVGVRFLLVADEIQVEGIGMSLNLTATLTLNDKGQCRLRVGDRELDRWQLLRRALEPVLFGPERR